MVDIPIELFLGFISMTVIFIVIGIIRKPNVPVLVVTAGVFILTIAVITTNIQLGYSEVQKDIFINEKVAPYNVTTNTGSGSSFNNSSEARTIGIESTSTLINKPIECISLQLRKVGTPPTTPSITFGTFNNTSGTLIKSFGTVTISSITNSFTNYDRCLPNGEQYFIQNGDRIGYRWIDPVGSDASNNIETRIDVNNPFDGTNTRQYRYGTSWTSDTGIDLQGMLYRNEDSATEFNTIEPNLFLFTQWHKVLFAFFGAILMLVGALMTRVE